MQTDSRLAGPTTRSLPAAAQHSVPHPIKPRLFLVSQHFAPDDTSTARYITELASIFATKFAVTVISGTAALPTQQQPINVGYQIIHVETSQAPKDDIVKRLRAMLRFSWRSYRILIKQAKKGDRVFVVTTPATLPYFVALASWHRQAPTAMILYDLYPDVLIASGLTKKSSLIVGAITLANSWLYHRLKSVVVIGHDARRRVELGSPASIGKTVVIPNWVDLDDQPVPTMADNRVRSRLPANCPFVVGLSGNLGFVHDPLTVLASARELQSDPRIHFLLSGWGVGWKALCEHHAAAPLTNATIIDRVPYEDLSHLLSSADAWIIPYKAGMDGVSVPSRLYNLLALGKPIFTLAGPDADHSRVITDENLGWVVAPGDVQGLVAAIQSAASDMPDVVTKGARAREVVARDYTRKAAGDAYLRVATELVS